MGCCQKRIENETSELDLKNPGTEENITSQNTEEKKIDGSENNENNGKSAPRFNNKKINNEIISISKNIDNNKKEIIDDINNISKNNEKISVNDQNNNENPQGKKSVNDQNIIENPRGKQEIIIEEKNKSKLSYDEVIKKIEELTGFSIYKSFKLNLNKEKKKIEGVYFQYDKGCILYSLINEGWVDEQYIPDSVKFYKNHNYLEDKRENFYFITKIISIVELAQLWINLGGESPYFEIEFEEAKRRIFTVIGYYFENNKQQELKNALKMALQNINYFSLLGNLNVKHFLLRQKINNNPNLKTAIDQNIIKQGDIVLTGTHFIIFNGIVEEDSKKAYSFIDSLCFYYKLWKDDKLHNDCKIHEKEGIVNAFENSPLINTLDSDELKIGKLEIIDR